jgi:uncharacterized protein YfiM (DUF2279 family)
VSVLEALEKRLLERWSMRRYLKFAASFWMSAFLMTGSMAVAQTKSIAKAKKRRGGPTASCVPTAMVGQDKHSTPLPQI